MSEIDFVRAERVWLKDHPTLREQFVQEKIALDPTILGLGDLVLRDRERRQPRAGRLDLLFQDSESNRRYEVEIQLGTTDESHIIRTIEYWDIERRRYPQYDHCAVIVAEDITSRFLNVIGLFNGVIPLIAIQMAALQVGNHLTLAFTTVLDELTLGLVEEDEEIQAATDRAYWEEKGTRETVAMADQLLSIVRHFDPRLELKYNKYYIGLARDGQPNNFVIFRAKKNQINVELRLAQNEVLQQELEDSGLVLLNYDKRWGRYRIRLTKTDVDRHQPLLTELLKKAYDACQEP